MVIQSRRPARPAALPLLLVLVAVAAAACARESDNSEAARNAATPPVESWRVNETSFGPVQFGMRLDEANAVLAGRLTPAEPLDSACDYVEPSGLGAQVAFMVIGGTVARVDVRDSIVATAEGARVGDSESRIKSLYEGRIEIEPHKYLRGGRYLIASPREASDTTHLIIFETNGKRVMEYRAGRVPEVEWVEGCG